MCASALRRKPQQPALPQIPGSMDNQLYDEIAKLNNELVDLHRELQKKNIELRKQIEQNNKFLGMAAHDLRNPLAVIQGYSDILLEETDGPLTLPQRQYLETMSKSSQLMLKLVNDLLTSAQFGSGKLQLDCQPTDLVSLIRHVLEMLTIPAEEKQITLNFISEQSSELLLDPLGSSKPCRT